MAPRKQKCLGQLPARGLRQIHNLWDIREIVQRIADCIGAPVVYRPEVFLVCAGLKIEQPHHISLVYQMI